MNKKDLKLYNYLKRLTDVIFASLALLFLFPLFIISYIVAALDTNSLGIFVQERVGQYGKIFRIYKLRTMQKESGKISSVGNWFRKTKIDELPQLLNVLNGSMSFVGPRPDISGYYDTLEDDERKILELKPGITSFAALKFYNEEKILSEVNNAKEYNDTILFPEKVRLNLEYYEKRSLGLDLKIILETIQRLLKNC